VFHVDKLQRWYRAHQPHGRPARIQCGLVSQKWHCKNTSLGKCQKQT